MSDACACPVCDSLVPRPTVRRADGAEVWRCQGCGLLFVKDRRGSNVTEYDASYFCGKDNAVGYIDYAASAALPGKQRLERAVLEALAPSLKGRRLLDVGCAYGHFLARARDERGLEVAGCELSPEAAERARLNSGLEVSTGTLAEARFQAGRFDAITYLDVIEHIPDPVAELREANRVLAPGGLIALLTPNAACLGLLGGRRWAGFQRAFEHVSYFSRRSLATALQKAGFEVLSSRTIEFASALPSSLVGVGAEPGPGRPLLRPARRLVSKTVLPILERLGYGHLLLMIGRKS